MRQQQPKKHTMNGLLILLLLGLFASCVLFVLMAGANSYQRLTLRDQGTYELRTCARYIAAKVRQAEGAEAISVASFGGRDALVLTQQTEEGPCYTRIYCFDGWLRELFTTSAQGFAPEDGEKLLSAQALSFTLDGDLLTTRITGSDGTQVPLALWLRGKKEAVS